MEQFVVFWLTVTFHEKNLIPDKCAILGNSINNEIALRSDMPMSDHRISSSKVLRDSIVMQFVQLHIYLLT